MKIVVSFDSFKGGMTAQEACEVARRAFAVARPGTHVETIPLADGGEGTAEILRAALGGQWITTTTMGPLPDISVESGFVWIGQQQLAIVEMARSSGLPLIPPGRRTPLLTTTFGTGQLLRAAIEKGAHEIWLTVGGSATVDGGTGAATALGWRFSDSQDRSLALGGGALENLAAIERPPVWSFPPCKVLCDVTNPLLGPRGAARTFGPQKGASPNMVECLERGLQRLADVIEREFGIAVHDLPGGGAAGGLAAGAAAFFNAHLTSGIRTVLDAVNYRERARDADWLITGEGRFDSQSLEGKVVSGVVETAKAIGCHVAVLAGSVKMDESSWRAAGIHYVAALAPEGMPLNDAIAREKDHLFEQIRTFCRCCLS